MDRKEIDKIITYYKRCDLSVTKNLDALFQIVRNTDDRELNEFVYNTAISNIENGFADSYDIYKKSLLFGARYDFDKYMIYLEHKRAPNERFYLPRRDVLLPLVKDIQKLIDDELDELFITLCPRVGKTTLLMFLATFIIGRYPEKSNLYSAFSDSITNSFYKGVLEVIQDDTTYAWGEIFPKSSVASTNSAYETIDIDRKKRYASLTCRSLYGTLNGACDCNGFLMADDLLSGIEEARSSDRLETAWMTVSNNLLSRCKDGSKIIWCGTRWSQNDPAGRRIEIVSNESVFSKKRIKVVNTPALNKDDESNFIYKYGLGYSTERFLEIRSMFERSGDMASWLAQYMGAPIERQGTVFAPEDLKYYNGELPCEPERIYIACDPAFGGGDYVAAPVCALCGDEVYVMDVVYSDCEKDVTQAELCAKIIKNDVTGMLIECTKTTMAYKEGIEHLLKEKGVVINIETQFVSSVKSKNERIMARAPEIRQFHFLEEGKRDKVYSKFMQNVFSYTQTGKNKHDDAPDALALAVDALRKDRRITVMQRLF